MARPGSASTAPRAVRSSLKSSSSTHYMAQDAVAVFGVAPSACCRLARLRQRRARSALTSRAGNCASTGYHACVSNPQRAGAGALRSERGARIRSSDSHPYFGDRCSTANDARLSRVCGSRRPDVTSLGLWFGRRSRLWHQEPHNRDSKQAYRCHTQKCCRPIKVRGDDPKECSAERSTKS